jgi:uroporphyrinogen III methyltransferase/synthase
VTVYLVGAGPGDPGLLTVRAAEVLGQADVVVHDRLAEVALLNLAPAEAERIDVGKAPGAPVDQDGINGLLVERGRAGQEVVRLKGGDPFVFGRGGEEAQALLAAGVPFEVVPGITSAVAVPAYAGIPVTHRGLSTSFTVVTGHSRVAVDTETDWEALARAGGTIVVLMGVAHRGEIAARLVAGGLAPGTPVAAVHWGTRPAQRSLRTTLAGLGRVELQPPSTIVIGGVAGLDLTWFEARPLFGRTVVVTRAREQASGLADRLRRAGAAVVEVPTVAVVDPADGGAALREAAAGLAGVDWVAFTSTNAVERLWAEVHDARAFGSCRIAAVGGATAEALAAHGLRADLVPPDRATAEGLTAAFPFGGGRVLLPQADRALPALAEGLAAKGWRVDVVEAYRTVTATPEPARMTAVAAADAITFTSGSTVTGFLAVADDLSGVPPVVVTIGPKTTAAAERAGLTVTAEAAAPSVEALAEAVTQALARSSRRPTDG